VTPRLVWEKTHKHIHIHIYIYKSDVCANFRKTPLKTPLSRMIPNLPHRLWQVFCESIQGFWFCGGSNVAISYRLNWSPLTQYCTTAHTDPVWAPGLRTDTLCLLAGCRKRRLNQAPLNLHGLIWLLMMDWRDRGNIRKRSPSWEPFRKNLALWRWEANQSCFKERRNPQAPNVSAWGNKKAPYNS